MLGWLRRGSPSPEPARQPTVATVGPNQRVYAVGDIHGRLDLLDAILATIREDIRNGAVPATIVFIGDYVDRGPDSAGVIERLARLHIPGASTIFLKGNHDEALHRCALGFAPPFDWLEFGGDTTLASYGIEGVSADDLSDPTEVQRISRTLGERMPRPHLLFLEQLVPSYRQGGYMFAHAGIRPGVPLDEQSTEDLYWIRERFLNSRRDHGAVIVHGHTIVPEPEEHPNRIAIDTGAHTSGRLTVLVLEGQGRRYLST